jgi:hypothetical protein
MASLKAVVIGRTTCGGGAFLELRGRGVLQRDR